MRTCLIIVAQLRAACVHAVEIPLCAGLSVVTAIQQRDGDYESIKTVESIGGGVLKLKYSYDSGPRRVAAKIHEQHPGGAGTESPG